MKTIKYITFTVALMVTSLGFLAAQEYDDLYYDPRSDAPEQTEEPEQQDGYVKSDYEKYREALEREAMNPENDSINEEKNTSSDNEYNEDQEYIGSDYMAEEEEEKRGSTSAM